MATKKFKQTSLETPKIDLTKPIITKTEYVFAPSNSGAKTETTIVYTCPLGRAFQITEIICYNGEHFSVPNSVYLLVSRSGQEICRFQAIPINAGNPYITRYLATPLLIYGGSVISLVYSTIDAAGYVNYAIFGIEQENPYL